MANETRKVTLTYELPAELVETLEQAAARNGHSFDDEVIAYLAKQLPRLREPSPEEVERRNARFERHFGAVNSGDPNSSDNERIDADLAREYGEGLDCHGSSDAT